MKLYYRAVSQDGKSVQGFIEGKDDKEVSAYLRKNNLIPIRITVPTENPILKMLPFRNSMSFTELVFFTRQLSSMLSSGLTLMQALAILQNQMKNPTMRTVVQAVIHDVEEGQTFAQAIAKHPNVFSPIYVSLMKAAEASGLLDKVLLRLADTLEKQQKLRGQIKGALIYPTIILIMMAAVTTIMMIFVIPQLSSLYASMNITLPLATRIVVGLSNFMVNFWPLVFFSIFIAVVGFSRWKKTPTGKSIVDLLSLKIPIFGRLTSQSVLVEFTRTFGLLVGTGSLVIESLNQTADVVGNVHFQKAIQDVAQRVEKGVSIGDALGTSNLFPPIVIEMVKIGEQTGKLDDSLQKVSAYYDREVEETVKALTTALEPMIMILLGLGVGFLVLSVITPLYNLISSIK